ncbi:hypothetical protein BME96_18920 (plasmid) [Virgibacillus halodenitrificans]|uniref:N-terminal domain-containing protein n=1 Tax=Virgibacillus halodenitrificans TaxID=1482 RepID=A0AAC9J2Q4_VIRHA|nr:ArdC family protein [Virgibacillus halodenitrificans]APC50356.1 hypothetical protein BME96_18920 [Virgibacillus halodenitrificans]AVD54445.1 hypothetical protein CKF96_02730 [Priestia filamentosa]
MAKKNYSRKTSEERKAEIKELSASALEKIEKYTKSEESLKEFADFMARFYHYSARNNTLIQNQFEGALAVASFKDWKEKGYAVNKGEKGIKILSFTPITRFKNKNGEVKQLLYATKEEKEQIKKGEIKTYKTSAFKVGHVFDVSQTNAPVEDLPKIFPNRVYNFEIEEGNNAVYLKKGIDAVAKELNIEIKDMKDSKLGMKEIGSARGVYVQALSGQSEILLNSRNTETQNLATSIHELAHTRLHRIGNEDANFDKATKEFQAELTSYIVCKHYGMDTSEKAIPYIANWTQNGQKIEDKQRALEGVHASAKQFIEVMDSVITKEREKEIPLNYQEKLELIQKNNGLGSNSLELENTEFWRKLETSNPEDYKKYLTYKPLYEHENKHGEVKFEEPTLYIHGVTNDFDSFGKVNEINLQPYKYADVTYTVAIPHENGQLESFSGKYYSNEYDNPLHHITKHELSSKDAIGRLEKSWNEHLIEKGQGNKKEEGLYPKNKEDILYCHVTGKPIAQDEGYYHVEIWNDSFALSEEVKETIYSDKDWDELKKRQDNAYFKICDYEANDGDLTKTEPKPFSNHKDVIYHYDGTKEPEKLGSIADVYNLYKQSNDKENNSYLSRQTLQDLVIIKEDKEEMFNMLMEESGLIKNPTVKDFQKVNEKLGIDKDLNLENAKEKKGIIKKMQMAQLTPER